MIKKKLSGNVELASPTAFFDVSIPDWEAIRVLQSKETWALERGRPAFDYSLCLQKWFSFMYLYAISF